MLIHTLELLAVSFILGMLITGVALGGLRAFDTTTRRFRHRGAASVDQIPLRSVDTRASDRSRAA